MIKLDIGLIDILVLGIILVLGTTLGLKIGIGIGLPTLPTKLVLVPIIGPGLGLRLCSELMLDLRIFLADLRSK